MEQFAKSVQNQIVHREFNIEQFISFQQQYRRAREQEAYSSSAESLVARSLLSLPTNERLTVIEEMGQKAWDQALTKMENTAYDSTDADDDAEADVVEGARRRAAFEAAAADNEVAHRVEIAAHPLGLALLALLLSRHLHALLEYRRARCLGDDLLHLLLTCLALGLALLGREAVVA